ncbi:MAG TPA: hypothetical protein EYQ24_04690 [Bacteroidetes bacterium]|nr:hypothetical protein [Bacteroidota bacterium]HIL57445.1 hypothetical protein [Rhodothermales bacterium]
MELLPFMPFLIPIVAILAWAGIQISKNLGGGPPDESELHELRVDLASLGTELEDALRDREKLRKRIENLEAIVTATDAERPLLDLDALPDAVPDAAEAHRQRSRA